MQVGTHPSLAAFVAATPKFGAAELKTFQDASVTIINTAESILLDSYGKDHIRNTIANLRDLQDAFKNGFPVERSASGVRLCTPKLPPELAQTGRNLDNCMGLYLALSMVGPAGVACETTLTPVADQVITLKQTSPLQSALDQLEGIRNDIRTAIPK